MIFKIVIDLISTSGIRADLPIKFIEICQLNFNFCVDIRL